MSLKIKTWISKFIRDYRGGVKLTLSTQKLKCLCVTDIDVREQTTMSTECGLGQNKNETGRDKGS